MRPRIVSFVAAACLCLTTAGSLSARDAGPREPTAWLADALRRPASETRNPGWERLRYRSLGLAGRLEAEVDLSTGAAGPGDEWQARLRMDFDGLLSPPSSSEARVWFDPEDASVRWFDLRSLGERPDRKIYRFGERGAERLRAEPQSGDDPASPDSWERIRRSFHAYEGALGRCAVVSQPVALVALLPAVDLAKLDPDPAPCIFSGKTLYRLRVERAGRERVEVDYRIEGRDGPRARVGPVEARRLSVVAKPVAGKLEGEEAMTVDLWIDDRTGIPLVVRTGRGLARIDARLVEVVAAPADPRG